MLRANATHLVTGLALSLATLIALEAPGLAQEEASPIDAATASRGLSSLDPAVRIDAAQALGALGDPAAAEAPLTQTLRFDPVPEVRGWAARSLAQLGTPSSREVVAEAARTDADERVRALCAQLATPAREPETPFEVSPFEGAAPAPAVQGQAGVEARMIVVVRPGPTAQPEPAQVVAQPVVAAAEPLLAARLQLRQERRLRMRGIGFVTAGWTLFGVAYLGSMVGIEESSPLAAIPLFGGFIAASQVDDGPYYYDEYTGEYVEPSEDREAGLILSSVLQIVGFSLAIVGHVRRGRARRVLSSGRLAVVPTANGLVGTF